jgi:hypothetical protein
LTPWVKLLQVSFQEGAEETAASGAIAPEAGLRQAGEGQRSGSEHDALGIEYC